MKDRALYKGLQIMSHTSGGGELIFYVFEENC